MNIKSFLLIGAKLIAAGIAAFAAFAGIGQIVGESSGEECSEIVEEKAKIVDGIRRTQDVANRFTSLMSSMASTAECFVNLTNPRSAVYQRPQYYTGGGGSNLINPYNNAWVGGSGYQGGGQPLSNDGKIIRTGANIIEVYA